LRGRGGRVNSDKVDRTLTCHESAQPRIAFSAARYDRRRCRKSDDRVCEVT